MTDTSALYVKGLEKLIEKQEKKIASLEKERMKHEERIEPFANYIFSDEYAAEPIIREYRSFKKYGPQKAVDTITRKEYEKSVMCLYCIFGKDFVDNFLKTYKQVEFVIDPRSNSN